MRRRIVGSLQGSMGTGNGNFVALPDLVGKGSLAQLLAERDICAKEIPCIAFQKTDTPLANMLEEEWELVVISAPEAASLFVEAWIAAGRPRTDVACVGKKTKKALADNGMDGALLVLSAASGKDLAATTKPTKSRRVLLPVSVRARPDLQKMLEANGFSVLRLDIYDTVSVEWSEQQQRDAEMCSTVALASPSAIQIWRERVGTQCPVVCFGESSASACRTAGFEHVSSAARKGLEGWADEIARVATYDKTKAS
eukprot:230257-Rhodomonas_salina.1